ncbi:cytochrome c biogenesis protein CcdA [Bacillus velezensis]
MSFNYFLTFGAGFLSFISPCCLPLYPAFFILHNWCQYGRGENRKGDACKSVASCIHFVFCLVSP